MKNIELDRIRYDGYEIIIKHTLINYKQYLVSHPVILVSTKTSKKKRGKHSLKSDGHYSLVNYKNPFPIIRNIYKVFQNNYINIDFICFIAYEDKTTKRERVYTYYLEKMGFKKQYSGNGYFLFSKKNIHIKRKECIALTWTLYNEVYL